MSFYNGLLNLTNWAGNVIMPTLGALFIALAVVQFARGYRDAPSRTDIRTVHNTPQAHHR